MMFAMYPGLSRSGGTLYLDRGRLTAMPRASSANADSIASMHSRTVMTCRTSGSLTKSIRQILNQFILAFGRNISAPIRHLLDFARPRCSVALQYDHRFIVVANQARGLEDVRTFGLGNSSGTVRTRTRRIERSRKVIDEDIFFGGRHFSSPPDHLVDLTAPTGPIETLLSDDTRSMTRSRTTRHSLRHVCTLGRGKAWSGEQ